MITASSTTQKEENNMKTTHQFVNKNINNILQLIDDDKRVIVDGKEMDAATYARELLFIHQMALQSVEPPF